MTDCGIFVAETDGAWSAWPRDGMSLPFEITPREVKARLDKGEPTYLIDVREAQEHQIARLAGSELIPMRTVPAALNGLVDKAESALVVVFCHHGIRSLQVVNWLRQNGIEECQSMAGGIDLWSLEIDSSIPRY